MSYFPHAGHRRRGGGGWEEWDALHRCRSEGGSAVVEDHEGEGTTGILWKMKEYLLILALNVNIMD